MFGVLQNKVKPCFDPRCYPAVSPTEEVFRGVDLGLGYEFYPVDPVSRGLQHSLQQFYHPEAEKPQHYEEHLLHSTNNWVKKKLFKKILAPWRFEGRCSFQLNFFRGWEDSSGSTTPGTWTRVVLMRKMLTVVNSSPRIFHLAEEHVQPSSDLCTSLEDLQVQNSLSLVDLS